MTILTTASTRNKKRFRRKKMEVIHTMAFSITGKNLKNLKKFNFFFFPSSPNLILNLVCILFLFGFFLKIVIFLRI